MTDLEEAREFFSGDFYATKSTGIVIDEVGNHYARCSMEITRNHQNSYGGVMGGANFTLQTTPLLLPQTSASPDSFCHQPDKLHRNGKRHKAYFRIPPDQRRPLNLPLQYRHHRRPGHKNCLCYNQRNEAGKIIEIHIISLNFRFYMHDYRNLWIFVFISLFYTDNIGYFRDFIRIFMLISLKISAFGRFCAYNFAIFSFLYAFFPVFLILYRNLKKIYG